MTKPKTKNIKARAAQNTSRLSESARLLSQWQTYLYYGLAIIWGIVAIKIYLAVFNESAPIPGREPHPIVDQQYAAPSFLSALLASSLPLLPLTVCILSIVAARANPWRKMILGIQVLVVLGWLVYGHAMTLWTSSFQSITPVVRSLDDTIVRRAQCGDAVRIVDNYSFGAKTFYELKDRGYRLEATYDSPTGMLDSDAACNTYYRVRSQYPDNHIVLQIFTTNASGQPAPYLYKYAGRNTIRYGIFVKE